MTMWTIDDRYETMPWDALDAVVFDVGNVLLSYSPEEELEAFFPGGDRAARKADGKDHQNAVLEHDGSGDA